MYDTKLVEVFNRTLNLLEVLAGFLLSKLLFFDNVIKELTARDILHNQEQLFGCLDNFK